MTITPITLANLTGATLDGVGVFDVLMRANKAHLDSEFAKQRIRGPEYATVYLGSLQTILGGAIQFLLQRDKAGMEAQLLEQQVANAILEGQILAANKEKVEAEIVLLDLNINKTNAETALLAQKTLTEQAQILATGVDADSVVGRQKELYAAQTNGFTRDAEQKASKILIDTWSVRRTTDELTIADDTNNLDDVAIGRAVTKLLSGIGA